MITIGDLIDICKQLEVEFGSDCNVIIQIRDENGEFVSGDYCCAFTCDETGRLYLTNNPPRVSEYTS